MMLKTTPHGAAWVSFLFLAALVILDQLSKFLARAYFSEMITCNTGGSWGIPLPLPFLIALSFAALFFLIAWQQYPMLIDRRSAWWLSAGGIGNLIDRIWQGCVTDFIHVFSFPVFNLADIYLTLGVVFLVLFLRKSDRSA